MEGRYSCSPSALEEVMSKVELRGLGERSSAHTDGGGPEGRGVEASAARGRARGPVSASGSLVTGTSEACGLSTASCHLLGGVKSWNLYLPPFTFAFWCTRCLFFHL